MYMCIILVKKGVLILTNTSNHRFTQHSVLIYAYKFFFNYFFVYDFLGITFVSHLGKPIAVDAKISHVLLPAPRGTGRGSVQRFLSLVHPIFHSGKS